MTSASISTNPVQLSGWQNNFRREGVEATTAEQPNAESEVVAPDYFATLKAPIVRGRALDVRDKKGAPLAVVIDETLAQQIFPGEDPIGSGSAPPRVTAKGRKNVSTRSSASSAACNSAASMIRRRCRLSFSRRARCNGATLCCSPARLLAKPRWRNRSARSLMRSIQGSRSTTSA